MDNKWNKLQEIADESNGIIKTSQIEEEGLSRTILKKYVDDHLLVRESQGIYTLNNAMKDEYKVLQARSQRMVFSYGTALYLHGMSDRVPHIIDVTVPQGYNASRIKRENSNVRFHYVGNELWDMGLVAVNTPLGNSVIVYDKERCICDLIHSKRNIDKQLYTQAIKEYFGGNYNLRKIIKYSKRFGIEEIVRSYLEVLS
ncbi:type IV toxin-antitoxin system AbiEi family antitoxin domain-containing protein [Aminicella lysinilytica]|uniref:Putative AbiEi antitoxin of type IV toxin-antitoxin system n=1 Tax=Aminicella lysinilytica TaxID=433323 RepID=A0A4R6PYY3_9FIRM|nr:type IV toxin-antitoxin system AbiEi family antitoxin domain-containing protein [Aminicella lysinilytica]NLD10317.1 abortive infection protein [Clostridiales bacterium]TDP47702.1 putative AbiEi antitoxin of type IV toxin-antitoxin system [Aminicella lysinilytica]